MIAIIDYGMGNLRSVQKALESLGQETIITNDRQKIAKAQKLILPGVGAFNKAMQNLKKHNLIETIKTELSKAKPFLGICLGMQLLMETSAEHGQNIGLSAIKGTVDYFRDSTSFDQSLVVPHMGWNQIDMNNNNPLFQGIENHSYVYFVHSYYVNPKESNVVIGKTQYGINFCSALNKNNIYGVQFHPEKSGPIGLRILENFSKIS